MPSDPIQLSPAALVEAIEDRWPAAQVVEAVALLASSEGRFPAGNRRLPAELVRAIQRERLIAAMLAAAAARGYRATNVQDVIEGAGVSRPTFYEHFENKDDCFLAAFDAGAERLHGKVMSAVAAATTWRRRLRLGIGALLSFVAAEPQTARTLVVEARAGSPDASLRRVAFLDGWAACLEAEAHELLPEPAEGLAITAAAVVGGIESVLYARLCRGELGDLGELRASLVYFVVLHYQGQEAAIEELRA